MGVSMKEMKKYGNGYYDKLRKHQKIKTQRVYTDESDEKHENEKEESEENSDEWKVLLDGNESVHSIHFGTMPFKKSKKKIIKKVEIKENDEDLDNFLNESDENEQSEEDEQENEIKIKSILKRSKYQSKATNNKHIKWANNVYSDGNPNTKFHSPKAIKVISKNKNETKQKVKKSTNSNPWLDGLQQNKSSKSTQNGQAETTQFDRNKLLIPSKMVKRPDFNLLDSKNPKQIEMIYQSLNDKDEKNKFAEYSSQSTSDSEFKKLKESVIQNAMPNAPENALNEWELEQFN